MRGQQHFRVFVGGIILVFLVGCAHSFDIGQNVQILDGTSGKPISGLGVTSISERYNYFSSYSCSSLSSRPLNNSKNWISLVLRGGDHWQTFVTFSKNGYYSAGMCFPFYPTYLSDDEAKKLTNQFVLIEERSKKFEEPNGQRGRAAQLDRNIALPIYMFPCDSSETDRDLHQWGPLVRK